MLRKDCVCKGREPRVALRVPRSLASLIQLHREHRVRMYYWVAAMRMCIDGRAREPAGTLLTLSLTVMGNRRPLARYAAMLGSAANAVVNSDKCL